MAAPTAWQLYDNFLLEKSNGTQDLSGDTFSVSLLNATYTPDIALDVLWSAISAYQIAIQNGYSGPLTSILSLTLTSGNLNINMANVEWTAAGGNIVAHYAVIKNDTTGGLVAYSILDSAPADVTALDTKVLTVDIETNTLYDETVL